MLRKYAMHGLSDPTASYGHPRDEVVHEPTRAGHGRNVFSERWTAYIRYKRDSLETRDRITLEEKTCK